MNQTLNPNYITLYHATNFEYSQQIIQDGVLRPRTFYAITLSELNDFGHLDLTAHLKGNPDIVKKKIMCFADNPVLAAACSDHGSDVIFEAQIPYGWVKEHILGNGTYETKGTIDEIPIERVTKMLSSNPDKTKKALKDAGRLDMIVERCLITNL